VIDVHILLQNHTASSDLRLTRRCAASAAADAYCFHRRFIQPVKPMHRRYLVVLLNGAALEITDSDEINYPINAVSGNNHDLCDS
jgi:hypothetical protein